MNMPEVNDKKQPERKLFAQGVSATVWKNESKGDDGEVKTFNTVNIVRTYTDKEGNYKETSSFSMQDLPKIKALIDDIYNKSVVKDAKDFNKE